MTLPMFVDISSRDRFRATTTTVSHLDLVPPRLDEEEWLKGPSTSVSDELSMTFSCGRSGELSFFPPEAKHQTSVKNVPSHPRLTAVERENTKKNTSKERLLLLLFKVWYFTSILLSIWKLGNSDLLAPFCPGAEHLKVKKPVYVTEMRIHLHSTASYISLLMFPFSCEWNLAKWNEKLPETFDLAGHPRPLACARGAWAVRERETRNAKRERAGGRKKGGGCPPSLLPGLSMTCHYLRIDQSADPLLGWRRIWKLQKSPQSVFTRLALVPSRLAPLFAN